MLGTIINKKLTLDNDKTECEKYLQCSNYCNENKGKYMIEDKGDYFEVVKYKEVQTEKEYIDKEKQYNYLVSNFIHERYSINDELAILRQRDEKPSEYKEYYEYCEECKSKAKQKLEKYEE